VDTRTIWAERVAITNATRRPLGNADVALAETSPTVDDPGHDDFACRTVRESCVCCRHCEPPRARAAGQRSRLLGDDDAHTLQDAVTAASCSAGAIGHRRSGLCGVRLGPRCGACRARYRGGLSIGVMWYPERHTCGALEVPGSSVVGVMFSNQTHHDEPSDSGDAAQRPD